jgi:integrase
MKAAREHRVPLSARALEILEALQPGKPDDYILPGQKDKKSLSNMAFEMVMRRMELGHFTVHGMRSAFRDWAGEKTNFAREVAEAALAHVVGDAAEQAYRRGDALEKRRKLMNAWAAYCGAPPRADG